MRAASSVRTRSAATSCKVEFDRIKGGKAFDTGGVVHPLLSDSGRASRTGGRPAAFDRGDVRCRAAEHHGIPAGIGRARPCGLSTTALREFRWPDVGERFNWAIDWFDAIARGNDSCALWIVEEDGSSEVQHGRRDGPALRPGRRVAGVAGVRRATTCSSCWATVELWETMLAGFKLGAASACRPRRPWAPPTCATGSTAQRRRWWPMPPTRRSSRRCPATTCDRCGWRRRLARLRRRVCRAGTPETVTAPYGPAVALLHLRHHLEAQAGRAHAGLLPRRPPRRCTGSGCGPATSTSAISSPGWAKHAWSCFFAPWIAEATIFVYNYARFDAAALLEQIRRVRGSRRSARRRRCGGC